MLEVTPLQRKFLPDDFVVTTWEAAKPYADDLLNRELSSLADFQKFLQDESEFSAVLAEEKAWRYVRKSRDTQDVALEKANKYYVDEIQPFVTKFDDKIGKKIIGSPFAGQVREEGFELLLKKLQTATAIFREENIPLYKTISNLALDVDRLRGAMTVTLEGKSRTMEEAEDYLYGQDRAKREAAWKAMRQRLRQEKEPLDDLFGRMFDLRQQVARNAGFDNFRDYMFAEYNRFDYTPQDCANFHDGVRRHVVPIVKQMFQIHRSRLGVENLQPWDLAVDPFNRSPIRAFSGEDDLIEKSISVLGSIDADFGDVLRLMKGKGYFDLMTRPGKQPGGYLMDLRESNVPFMFTNFTDKPEDVVTMMHEAGHAVHETLMSCLPKTAYRDYPMEVAELGSMAMELLSSEYWDVFYTSKADLYRARREHLQDVIVMIPWMSIVDEFQQKIYTQENPSVEARHKVWDELCQSYDTGEVERHGGYPHPTRIDWHKQGHIFEVPFYYIDYAIAQMGALQIYRNYKRDPQKTVQQFKYAMSLGGTRSRPEIYAAAGVEFNFSSDMLQELMAFVGSEIIRLGELEMAEQNKAAPSPKGPQPA